MKISNKLLMLLVGGASLTGCADQEIDSFVVEKPASLTQYEYLDEYGSLLSYLAMRPNVNPDFKLGCGVAAADYSQFGQVYRITNENFNNVTPGNAMKYASIVDDDGTMNFNTVKTFIEAAKAGGITIYGHTLAWHSQQNLKWLNSLIADKEMEVDPDAKAEVQDAYRDYKNDSKFPFYVMGYEPQIIDGILTVPEYPGEWYQFFVMDGLTTVPDQSYTITAYIKGSKEGSLNVQFGNWGALQEKQMAFKDEWQECSVTIDGVTTTSSFVVFQPGTYDGKLEIEWIKLSHSEAPAVEFYETLITNGDAEGDDVSSFYAVEGGVLQPARIVNNPDGEGHVFAVDYPANPTEAWDAQFFIKSNIALVEGDKVKVTFRYKATDSRDIGTQAHGQPTNYHYHQFIGTLSASPEWKDHEWTGTISAAQAEADGCSSIAFNLSSVNVAGTFYIDDITYNIVRSGNSIPLTAEEKKEVLTAEMDRWIGGMMEACEGFVTAWDVVNEAISGGGNDGQGNYVLQSVDNVSATDAAQSFYWQDYLGSIDYVRTAVGLARKHFEANGGNPSDLKLFINDYNLESDWDDNKKLKSLIAWIDKWEADGVTKIDGIGTQMHISCYANAQTQKSKEDHVVKMFELMKASGKLCKITELDMGYVDANGNDVKTEDMTLEQHQAMANYYKFIINKYFEIIPQAQQYGITQWCQTDSPAGSGWRANSPVGLWTLDFSRKPAYAGFAEGLKGSN